MFERGPYYLDGLVPLAYLLDDRDLKATARKWVGWTLSHQEDNGWLGAKQNHDVWPMGVMLKVLTQYYEATGDTRVIPEMQKFCKCLEELLPKQPITSWEQYRWADTALSIIWLYNKTGDKDLLGLLKLIQQQGFDWSKNFTDFKYTAKTTSVWPMETHGVNNAMAVKTPGVQYEITGDDSYRKAVYTTIEQLDKYHGQATGIFGADEHLAGKMPSDGSELCAVVEYMFSLENLTQILGDPAFGDRLEKIAFNALPATISEDWWSHQYLQQANQVVCKVSEPRIYTIDGPESNLFGLEPNFGCCTANMHQGWPKFATHLWMATSNDGLAAIAYAPCKVTAKVKGGATVTADVQTTYPFEDTVRIEISTSKAADFPLMLRIPAWASGASVSVNGSRRK